MDILQLIVILALVGAALYLINRYIPMELVMKRILNIVVIVAVIIWLLKLFGIFDNFGSMHVGK